MYGPYWMVLVNVISLLLLSSGIITYRFIFPKKKIKLLIILLLFAILPLISIFRIGVYESGDLALHVQFAMGFFQSLQEGNLLPRWNEFTCGGYGCPDFIFLYILPYYLISIIHFVGISFLTSTKIFLCLAYIASGITIFIWLKNSFNEKAAFIGSLFYLFAPYHLVDLHFRTDVGEVLAFAIYPLLFYITKKLVDTKKTIYSMLYAVVATLLLLSHTTMFYSAIPLTIVYFVVLWLQMKHKEKYLFIQLLLALIATLLLSMFYWLPLIYQSKLIYYGLTPNITLHSLSDLLYSPWRYGFLFQGHKGELSYIIGYVQLFTVLLSIILFYHYKPKKNRIIYWYFLFSFIILCLLMLNFSKLIWETVPFMNKWQDSHRLLLPINLFASGIAAYITNFIKNKYIFYTLCILAIVTTILNWGNRGMLPNMGDTQLKDQLVNNRLGHHNIVPIWVDVKANWSVRKPAQSLEVIKGKGIINELKITTNVHEYHVIAKNNILLRENTHYFPGWTVYVDGAKVPIDYKYSLYPGLIIFAIPRGNHIVTVQYQNIDIQTFSNTISVATAGIMLLYSIIFYLRKPHLKKNKNER